MPELPPILSQRKRRQLEYAATNAPTDRYLSAAAAKWIPAAERGLWYIRKIRIGWSPYFTPGDFTTLHRWTDSTIHLKDGETVMTDTLVELSKHLEAAMRARGKVLVTGLGLGCVLRMLQANPNVEQITLVEISQDVIDLVWPYTSHDRVELIHADAGNFLSKTDRTWDVAWHDIWTDTGRGEPHLKVAHLQLMAACSEKVQRQGAWAFPRHMQRAVERIMTR